MRENVYKKTLKRIEKIEENFESFESFVKTSTNFDGKHKMKIEDDYIKNFQLLNDVYDELRDFETIELLDARRRFDGEFD